MEAYIYLKVLAESVFEELIAVSRCWRGKVLWKMQIPETVACGSMRNTCLTDPNPTTITTWLIIRKFIFY